MSAESRASPLGGGDLVLIVEDNEQNLKLARDLLRFHGFATIEATNAEEGLLLARQRGPRVVLMDIQLPGMDGVRALEELRTDGATSAIPVVAMTASVMKEERERFDRAGFDGFITKPIDVKRFPGQVREAMDRRRA
ncbi:MAG: response regulator [Candidatus Limnocylindria bacterium]